MDNTEGIRRAKALLKSGTYRYLLPENLTMRGQEASDTARAHLESRLAAWVSSHGPAGSEMHDVAEKFAKQIRYVSLPDFYQAFDRQLDWLNKNLKMPYHLVNPVKTAKHGLKVPSSTSWLGQRVIRKLRAPLHGIILSQPSRYGFSGDDPWPENVVYADDGTYSATQITEFVRGFVTGLLAHKLPKRLPDLNIWLAIPFRTPHGDGALRGLGPRILDELAAKARAFTDEARRRKHSAAIRMLRERLTVHVSPFFERVPSALEAARALSLDLKTNPGAGMLIFEHKAPDWMSFPAELASGCRIGKKTGSSIFADESYKYSFHCHEKTPIMSPRDDDRPYDIHRPGIARHMAGGSDDMHVNRIDAKGRNFY